jgi:nucleotide-binding universal stress UspA family protein
MAIQAQSGTADQMAPARRSSLSIGRRVLAVIDGEPGARAIFDFLTTMPGQDPAGDIVLLNLQPRPDEVRTRAILADKVHQHLMARGQAVIAKVKEALVETGLTYRSRVEIGDDAETIVRCAHEEGCNLIVLTAREAAGLHRRLLKSTGIAICSRAGQVAEISDLPVLILKPRVQ